MALFGGNSDAITLKDDEIVNIWHTLIPAAAGQGEKFLQEVERQIEAAGLPDMPDWAKMKRKQVSAKSSKMEEDDAGPYPFLYAKVISRKVFIGARDYGKNLIVSKYIADDDRSIELYGMFAREARSAYLGIVHQAVLDTVKLMVEEIRQNSPNIDKQSKGFIEIS